MDLLTKGTASDYVLGIEAEWGLKVSKVVRSEKKVCDGLEMIDVWTDENYWSVWVEGDGRLYGEC